MQKTLGIWLSAAALSISLLTVLGILGLLTWNGLQYFWPTTVYEWQLNSGEKVWGELRDKDDQQRILIKQGNRDTFGADFLWVKESDIKSRTIPRDIILVERDEWGTLIGKSAGNSNFLLSNGTTFNLPAVKIIDSYYPNQLNAFNKFTRFWHQIWRFLSENPREANTEGGVFPAIFGTVVMVFLMSILVTPFAVIAAIYLHEYAKQGLAARLVRIAVTNLAGVPSVVYGVFGLGLFVYICGGYIDQWFFSSRLPAPTFGTPGLLWASLTLALLTAPVVIVATEEGLARIPRTLREGSYALGATHFETLMQIILPVASPAFLTGLILAIARAAGEVAPLMLVGVVKLAPELPLDTHFPFLHLERKFMHLGFHIYDVGFQSPNIEAARPLVFATALLLVLVIIILNLCAIVIRNRLRERFSVYS